MKERRAAAERVTGSRPEMKEKVYIYGHKSPDTDSICSAIATAWMKNALAEKCRENPDMFWGQADPDCLYVARAAGKPNSETEYVLKKFGVEAPEVVNDVRRQISDIGLKKISELPGDLSIREAWIRMQEEEAYTAPVVENGKITGIITTGDVSRTYMNVHDKELIGKAHTPYRNLLDVVQGRMVVGSPEGEIDGGRVLIIAAKPGTVGIGFKAGDIAILSNDMEAQKKLIETGARCMIITMGMDVTDEVKKLAEENNVRIILTEDDTYKVAKIINQSIPIRHFVLPIDEVCGFCEDDFMDDIRDAVVQKRHRDFPVMTSDGSFCGMITKSHLMEPGSKKIIMVDHNEQSQAVFGINDCQVVEIIDHHKLGTVETLQPISLTNRPVGCTATIVWSMCQQNGLDVPHDIMGLLCSAILSDTMLFKSPTCTEEDRTAAETMAAAMGLDLEAHWNEMLKASLDLDSKSEREIMYQDYKRFEAAGTVFGAGQILAADEKDVEVVKSRMCPYLETALEEEGVDFVSLMITNVSDDSTDLIFFGGTSTGIMESAFGVKAQDGCVHLPGVVSRKKQLIPPLMAVLQQ